MSLTTIAISGTISTGAYLMTLRMIPRLREMFIKAHLYGKDLCKKDKPQV